MPLVSIIIPVFNSEKYLKRCLNSVIFQTYPKLEIIIINDASTDHSLCILEEYEQKYKNIKLINKTKNEGLSSARNTGLEQAQGEYIYFLDSDDWIKKDTIEKLLTLLKIYKTPLAIGNYVEILYGIPKRIPLKKKATLVNLEDNKNLLYNDIGSVWNKLYHRELIDNLKFPSGLWYEDNAFNYPLLAKAKQFVKTNEVFYYYRRHFESITLTGQLTPTSKALDYYEIAECLVENFQNLHLYNSYKEQVITLANKMIINPLLTSFNWNSLSFEDKKNLLYSLASYTKNRYGIEAIEDHPFIKKRIEKDFFYRKKMQSLRLFLEEAKQLDDQSIEPLDEAKRILDKYKR